MHGLCSAALRAARFFAVASQTLGLAVAAARGLRADAELPGTTTVTVSSAESTSATAFPLNSAVHRFMHLLPTWCYFLRSLRSQSSGVHDQGKDRFLALICSLSPYANTSTPC